MSPATKANWNTFAATYPQPTKKNPALFLSGYQLFIKRNSYLFLIEGLNSSFMESPTMENLPAGTATFEIKEGNNCINMTELYIQNFGCIPFPGQFVLFMAIPMSATSGQFFTPIIDVLEIEAVYIDGFFLNVVLPAGIRNIIFSVYLSKPVSKGQSYAGTKVRFMGCFSSKTFLELTDAPHSYVGQAEKFVKVKVDETGLEFTTPTEVNEALSADKCGLVIYDENLEWSHMPNDEYVFFNSTEDPYNKTISLKIDKMPTNNVIDFQAGYEIHKNKYAAIVLYVKLLAIIPPAQSITLVFLYEDEHTTNDVTLTINKTLLNVWQPILVPISLFTFDAPTYTGIQLFFRISSGSGIFPKMYIDYIALMPSVMEPDCTCFCRPSTSGGLTCADLPNCPTIISIESKILTLQNQVSWIITQLPYSIINYGYLYNGYCQLDAKGIVRPPFVVFPAGIFNLLPGGSSAGGRLKEMGTTHWQTPNTGATDEIKFNWRGSGRREPNGSFLYKNQYSYIWQKPSSGPPYTANYSSYNSSSMSTGTLTLIYGCCLRAYRPNVVKPDGTLGVYIGNDLKRYKTVVYQNNEFLCDHLAETIFNDGSLIPNITLNSAWAAAVSSCLCAYDNDINNV
jgi:hypothetical protein